MRTMYLDTEGRSGADLRKTGAYRWAADERFALLMVAWAFDDGPVEIWSLDEGPMPAALADALDDPTITKVVHNAGFELAIFSAHLGRTLDPTSWRCTMVHAASLGLPRSLDKLSKYLRLADLKDAEGKRLIQKFCKPVSAGGAKGTFRDPADHADDWQAFREYCRQDVATGRAIARALASRPMPENEWALWHADQRINQRGVRFDRTMAEHAVTIDTAQVAERHERMCTLTGLDNPNSLQQLAPWLASHGVTPPNLLKGTVADLVAAPGTPDVVREVLRLRLENANKSTSKFVAMLTTSGRDDRVRGLFQFYGADTGRWAGRLVQLQNLAKASTEGQALADLRARLVAGDPTLTSADLKDLIRPTFVPEPGNTFLVADYAAIEARVLAWLAGEEWVLDVFRGHGKIYEATAAQMLGITIEEVTKADRQRGKVATLALGYGGTVGAMVNMGALKMGLGEDELPEIVAQWRRANPAIVKLWAAYERAFRTASLYPKTVGRCRFERSRGGTVYVTLPSGRSLAYPKTAKVLDRWGRDGVTYLDTTTGARIRVWGGLLAENITQAVARDVLGEALLSLDLLGIDVVAHIHDEIVVEAPSGSSPDDLAAIMSTASAWSTGLPLAAEAFSTPWYTK